MGDLWRRDTYGFVYKQLFEDGRYNAGIPDVTLTGFAALTGPSGANSANAYDNAITDTLTWVRGAHTVKAGVAYTRTINNQIGVVTSFYTGTVVFNPAGNPNSTGNPLPTCCSATSALTAKSRPRRRRPSARHRWTLS